jgi:hypothetical protein
MSRTKLFVLLAVGVAFVSWIGAPARADLLMLDTFDSATEVDVSTGIGTPRQTGTLVPVGGITYTKVARSAGNLGVWNCNGGNGPNEPELIVWQNHNETQHGLWQDLNYSTLAGTTYYASVHMDFDGNTGHWGVISVAETQDNLASYLPKTGVNVDIDSLGNWEFNINGATVSAGAITAATHYDVTLAMNEAAGTAKLLVDGTELASHSATWASSDRYLGIEANLNSSAPSSMWFNNLSLNSGVPVSTPEPSSMALLGSALFGLLAYAWRKRK